MTRSSIVVLLLGLAASLASPAVVSSQTVTSDLPGITTTGVGEASAPAESAAMEIILSDTSYFMGPPPLPEPEATPGARARTTVSPVADAVSAIEGVEEVEVVVPQIANPYGAPAPLARLTFTVTDPTLDQLDSIVTAAAQAAAGELLLISHVGARFETSDCAMLEREARQAALEDARHQAGIQADVLGVGLGAVIASVDITDPYLVGTSSAGCDPELGSIYLGDPNLGISLPAFDPTRDPGEVEVYRQVRVTFAIDSGDAASEPADVAQESNSSSNDQQDDPSEPTEAPGEPEATAGPTEISGDFEPDYQTSSEFSIHLRSEPSREGGEETVITTLPPETPLQFTGTEEPATDPDDGERWMLFRTEDGQEGWIREIDVIEYQP